MGPTLRDSTYPSPIAYCRAMGEGYALPLRLLRPCPWKGASRVVDCGAIGGWVGETNGRGGLGETMAFLNILRTPPYL